MPPGIKPPQHCASPGRPGLYPILLQTVPSLAATRLLSELRPKTKKAAEFYPCGPVRAHVAITAAITPRQVRT
ncbi:hypothetical protein C8256_05740 [Kluyvera genomosp. 2]|uniref:Uncharacterized protein n=1 Tax=Kluyvera genomosp. 2 TaxID=2774054 RepID=A0A2T2Y5M1_9ENTR|nr:hypothetical protein C8256_05740 [Kluyvera genomosp. 2]